MNEYRFTVNDHDGTISRGRAYRLPESWTTDSWAHYWDSDGMVAFYADWPKPRPVADLDNDEIVRAMRAWVAEQNSMTGSTGALDRLAKRIGGPDSAFVTVHLDRGVDLIALAWDGDPDRAWRDEIEAVYHGDIWRIEVEDYVPGYGPGGSNWVPSDEYPEEFYGESQVEAEFPRVFDLDAFPADLLVAGSD